MTTPLDPIADLTGAGISEVQGKTWLTNMRAYLAGLLGTDGVPATALGALGIVNQNVNVNVTTVGNVGTGLDNLMSYTLPANSLSATGKRLRIKARGTTANNANAKTLAFAFGAVTFTHSIGLTVSQAGGWAYEIDFVRDGTTTATVSVTVIESGDVVNLASSKSNHRTFGGGTFDFTISNAVTIKGQATADNDVQQNFMSVELLSP